MKIAFLTSGGLAPCLSASIGALVAEYSAIAPEAKHMGYLNGYRGLLLGQSIDFPDSVRQNSEVLMAFGGSPIGSSRVKLTNSDDCVSKGYIREGENPLEIAAEQLIKDDITILHTMGGDDTNTMAAALLAHLAEKGHDLTVVGLPKTVDNDVTPITQSLGAWTAAEQGAIFFENIANENTTSTRQLIIHEVMGRHCGWLTAATAREYRSRLGKRRFLPELLISRERWDVDAVYVPELTIDFSAEVERLRRRMDEKDGVNIFLSEGAGVKMIVAEMEAAGEDVPRDPFGHVRLDDIQPGQWFAKQFTEKLGAEKTLVQKSGYFARSAAPNDQDLELIRKTAKLVSQFGIEGNSGVVGMDQDDGDKLGLISFDRIKGGKPFDTTVQWFVDMLNEIGQ
ncbi:MAG TPA: pyrophosphate--fructose-6-phosphate 1-phosphotransferase [Candidatus Marinimicrobia bacterium]|jgi:pyrophosphate--fructose-6-phosphate 1-phosphotransferase|nr:pyrophosphate--fructose-6-phosphate 1-phosphotransferase [Candidatus Neomarinimicrobiota bacterium]HIN45966.1 pyrophosphate--fructose-6-phosphate 1-phosphotransferase [Candidatus Neomarinimicrobiota bacterium]